MVRNSIAVLSCVVAALVLSAGCESSGGHASDNSHKHGDGKMKCSGCSGSMSASDCAVTCACGATMKCGDIKCKCSKCGHECTADKCTMKCACGKTIDCEKMAAAGGKMTCSCGKTLTCSDVICACPKCGGKMDANTKCKCGKEMTCSDKCMACASKK